MENASDNSNITKEMKKNTIGLIKETVKDRKFKKEIIGQVKKLDYNQPEKTLAYLLLSNNLIRVYVRAFHGLQKPNYFFQWLNDDYNEISGISEITSKVFETMNSSHQKEFGLMDGQRLTDVIDTNSDGQLAYIEQKKAIHSKMIETYNTEARMFLKDIRDKLRMIKNEKRRLEMSLSK